ncbi:hypothetical protein L484_021466 [Morus notabilis]|uniref:Uncharacterized protein n=1 Tax=Morus notabilis TaxID=981085 RepID=W9T0A2_9ROSA|nr:hypothetical protein L484_021466 [Morus notabilis]
MPPSLTDDAHQVPARFARPQPLFQGPRVQQPTRRELLDLASPNLSSSPFDFGTRGTSVAIRGYRAGDEIMTLASEWVVGILATTTLLGRRLCASLALDQFEWTHDLGGTGLRVGSSRGCRSK